MAALADVLRGLHATTQWQENLYKDIHAHPELSFQETRTAGLVASKLKELGYEVIEGIGRTGVLGILRNGEGGTVLARADMDALPVKEATGLPYASTATAADAGDTVNVSHACGHDAHVTCLLGAAELLAQTRSAWCGTLVALFQPAEEVAGGAKAMVDDGLRNRFPKPDVAFAQHVLAFPAGSVGTQTGPVLSAGDSIRITLHGKGAHGSMPHNSVDTVVLASQVVLRLQTIVSRETKPGEFVVLTVGSIAAGSKSNIIPDRAILLANLRTYDMGVRKRVISSVERIVRAECEASGCPQPPEFEYLRSVSAHNQRSGCDRARDIGIPETLRHRHRIRTWPSNGQRRFQPHSGCIGNALYVLGRRLYGSRRLPAGTRVGTRGAGHSCEPLPVFRSGRAADALRRHTGTRRRDAGVSGTRGHNVTTYAVDGGHHGYRGTDTLIFGIVLAVFTFWLFAQSTLNIAPAIRDSLGITENLSNTAVSISALFSGIFIVIAGGLADRFGRVKLTNVGLALSAIGSLLIAISPAGTATFLIAGRAIQGMSAACIMPATLALMKAYFDGKERQRALSYWSIGSWGGAGASALFGGLVAASLGWRSIFWLSILGAIVSFLLIRGTPESKVTSGDMVRFDWYGFAAFTIGMVAVNVVIGQGAVLGWRSPAVIALTVVFIVAAVLFFKIESNNPNGFVDLTLFRNSTYTGATLSNFLINGAAGTLLVALSLVQQEAGLSSLQSGLLTVGYLVAILSTDSFG